MLAPSSSALSLSSVVRPLVPGRRFPPLPGRRLRTTPRRRRAAAAPALEQCLCGVTLLPGLSRGCFGCPQGLCPTCERQHGRWCPACATAKPNRHPIRRCLRRTVGLARFQAIRDCRL